MHVFMKALKASSGREVELIEVDDGDESPIRKMERIISSVKL